MGFYRKVDDHYEITIDHSRILLAVIGGVLVVSLVFLVGVLVGKSMWAPQGPQLAIGIQDKAAEPAKLDGGEVKPAKPAKPKERPMYTFYDEVKKPENHVNSLPEPVREDDVSGGGASVVTPVGNARGVQSGEAEQTALPEERKPQPAEPEAAARPQPKPAPRPEPEPVAVKSAAKPSVSASGTVYSVQIYSFAELDRAKKSKAELEKKGLSVHIAEGEVKGRTWYRIRVGEFATRDEAQAHLEKVVKPKGLDGYVVKR